MKKTSSTKKTHSTPAKASQPNRHKNQTTKLFRSSDNFFNAQVTLLPLKDGKKMNVVLNEQQALGFGVNMEDNVTITKGDGEKVVANVIVSSEMKPGTIGIYEDILTRLPLTKGETLSIEIAQSSSLANDAIRKKMRGESISYDEMFAIIKDISEGKLSEVMMTYYVASSFFYSTTDEEMYQVAKAMAECGIMFKHPKGEIIADKHCIGGVPGNETTMIMIPIVASLGIKIPKSFSKAITSPAATGECVNILMDINFTQKEIEKLIKEIDCCLVWGGSLDLAPADDKIIKVQYPLAIQSRAKVVSSIMAKKYAMGITHCLIDIPVGTTAKVASMEEALDWKKKFEYVGNKLGMKMSVEITPAMEVIGNGVGATLQVREVLRVLQQHEKRPHDLETKSIHLAAKIIEMVGMAKGKKAEELARKQIENGEARKMMQKIIKAQKGNPKVKSEEIQIGDKTFDVLAQKDGKVQGINLHNINQIARRLGCPSVNEAGVYLHKKIGDKVKKGDVIYTMHANDNTKIGLAKEQEQLKPAFTIE
jgi:AMP phosphorylase